MNKKRFEMLQKIIKELEEFNSNCSREAITDNMKILFNAKTDAYKNCGELIQNFIDAC